MLCRKEPPFWKHFLLNLQGRWRWFTFMAYKEEELGKINIILKLILK
jgi:hypothetical protein